MFRSFTAAALVGVLAVVAPASARAERLTTLIVGYTAGGSTDTIARVLAPALKDRLGQNVIVEDRPGAAAQIASRYVSRAAPDGRVLQVATQTSHAVAPALNPRLDYDPVKDFTPIALVAWTPLVLIANAEMPVSSVRELIQYLKDRPGEVTYATGGRGDGPHVAGLFFNSMAGTRARDVPFQGDGAAMPAVLGGHVPFMFCLAPTAASGIETGRVKALAVTSKERIGGFPNVPTMAEAGLPGYDIVVWWGIFGPPGMEPGLVKTLNAAILDVLKQPEVGNRLRELGYQVTGTSPEEFARYVKDENARWGALIRSQGVGSP